VSRPAEGEKKGGCTSKPLHTVRHKQPLQKKKHEGKIRLFFILKYIYYRKKKERKGDFPILLHVVLSERRRRVEGAAPSAAKA